MHGRTLAAAAAALILGLAAAVATSAADGPTRVSFDYTGGVQTFTVPADVTLITVTLDGAQGGAGCLDDAGDLNPAAPGGKGAHVVATLAVTPGDVYEVRAGGAGGHPGDGTPDNALCPMDGGYNGGGGFLGDGSGRQLPGGGGGASDLRPAGGAALLVAGGGGGGGGTGDFESTHAPAGAPGVGGSSGAPGTDGGAFNASTPGLAGQGATASAGGAGGAGGDGDGSQSQGGAGDAGTAGRGGDPTSTSWSGGGGGGGGGGLYGGGAGGAGGGDGQGAGGGGGGGGSSYAAPAATGVAITEGQRTGDGRVTISYTAHPATTPTTTTTTETTTTTTTVPDTTPTVPVVVPEPPVVGPVVRCAGRRLTLVDVRLARDRVALRGLALAPLAGKEVAVSGDHGGGSTTARVRADGSFSATLPRPRSPETSYTAIYGESRSSPLKLTRHLTIVTQRHLPGGIGVVAQHAQGARVAGERALVLRQTGCGAQTAAGTATFDRHGRVTAFLAAPAPPDTIAVYRLAARTNRTFTLPIVVRR